MKSYLIGARYLNVKTSRCFGLGTRMSLSKIPLTLSRRFHTMNKISILSHHPKKWAKRLWLLIVWTRWRSIEDLKVLGALPMVSEMLLDFLYAGTLSSLRYISHDNVIHRDWTRPTLPSLTVQNDRQRQTVMNLWMQPTFTVDLI